MEWGVRFNILSPFHLLFTPHQQDCEPMGDTTSKSYFPKRFKTRAVLLTSLALICLATDACGTVGITNSSYSHFCLSCAGFPERDMIILLSAARYGLNVGLGALALVDARQALLWGSFALLNKKIKKKHV